MRHHAQSFELGYGNNKRSRVINIKTILGLTLIVISCMMSSIPMPASAATETSEYPDYSYYYKGKLIIQNPSERYIAIEDQAAEARRFIETQQLKRAPISDRVELKNLRLGIYVLPVRQDDTSSKSKSVAELRSVAPKAAGVQPVFEQGQALLIPTNEVIVGFDGNTAYADAVSYFSQLRGTLGILKIEEHRKNAFILNIDNHSNGRAYDVSRQLSRLNGIRFAEPNHLIIQFDMPQTPVSPDIEARRTQPVQTASRAFETTHNSPVTWTELVNEGCEGMGLPAGWTTGRFDATFTDAQWNTTNFRSHAGARSCYATGAGTAGVAAPGDYPNNAYSWLNTPTLDLSVFEEVYVELWFYARYQDPGGWNGCSVRDFGGIDVIDATTGLEISPEPYYLAICEEGDLTLDPTTDTGWRRALMRIPPDLRINNVQIRFFFSSNPSVTEEGLYVDQIRIVGTADVDTEPLGNDTYSARHYEFKNAGQIAGLGDDSNDMNIPEAWNLVTLSNSIVVAIIDSGVDLGHADLNLDTGYDPDGSVGGSARSSHGTSVAGNAGAIGDNSIGVMGTAPGVRIMPVYRGSTNSENADAIDTAVANGADILSNSWGWVGAPSTDIEDAITDALAANVVVLFAAGNGPDRSPWTYDVAFPASLCGTTDVICVGASSPTDEHKAAASSDGSFWWGSSYLGDGPDVVAPSPWSYTTDRSGADGYNDGSLIDPTDPASADYTPTFGGTSSSTPKVAGIVALMLSANPGLTPAQVKQILRDTADDIDQPGVDDKTGAGRVNAYAAVRDALPPPDLSGWTFGIVLHNYQPTDQDVVLGSASNTVPTDNDILGYDRDTAYRIYAEKNNCRLAYFNGKWDGDLSVSGRAGTYFVALDHPNATYGGYDTVNASVEDLELSIFDVGCFVDIHTTGPFSLDGYAGLRYVDYGNDMTATYTGGASGTQNITRSAENTLFGVHAGLESRLSLLDYMTYRLYLEGHIGISLLTGESEFTQTESFIARDRDLAWDSTVPAFEGGLALVLRYQLADSTLSTWIGYDMLRFEDLATTQTFLDSTSPGSQVQQGSAVGFEGYNLGISISF